MNKIKSILILVLLALSSSGQNENSKWYFGTNAALDFMTSPPTVLNNSAMNNGGSSIADAAGNLLFYTNISVNGTVWNRQHQVMANGTGLIGGGANPLIVKHTANPNLYYLFHTTPSAFGAPIGSLTALYCSIVDMSLAVGMGSVTVKNLQIYNGPCQGFLHATKHANGTDVWIMAHEFSGTSNNFRAYLLTSSGVNPSVVISPIGPEGSIQQGCIKFSPTGQKLCVTVNVASVVLYDFNNSTGILSNSLTLLPGVNPSYGCEFSPDGSKLYAGSNLYTPAAVSRLTQWDLSAGNSSAIVSSSVNLMYGSVLPYGLQLAPDGKIYMACGGASLSVINNPNAAGPNCNIVLGGQPVSAVINPTLISDAGGVLPNMMTSITNTPCVTQTVMNTQSICTGGSYAIANKTHTAAGIYFDTLVNIFSCNGIVIMKTQLTVNSLPNMIVTASPTTCLNTALTFTASGANTYTWNSNITGSQFISPTFTQTGNYTYSLQLAGTGNAGCIFSNNLSFSVSVLGCDVGIKQNDLTLLADNVVVFPNPSSGNLNILFSGSASFSNVSYVISNNLGQSVLENQLDESSMMIRTSQLPDGLYQIQFKTPIGCLTKKFVKN